MFALTGVSDLLYLGNAAYLSIGKLKQVSVA